VGCVANVGEKKNAYRVLIRKPEGKRLLRRPLYSCGIILK
jgi:hypothetical protein